MELSSGSKKQNQGFQITIPIISTLQFGHLSHDY